MSDGSAWERDLRGGRPGGGEPLHAAGIVYRICHNPMTEQTLQAFEASIIAIANVSQSRPKSALLASKPLNLLGMTSRNPQSCLGFRHGAT